MTEATIRAGACGFATRVRAQLEPDGEVVLSVTSDCPSVRRLAQSLIRLDPLREISYRGQIPAVLDAARSLLPHPACVVPSGILKAVEVAAGLALPTDAGITFDGADGAIPQEAGNGPG
ncbi:MAG: hypothetical protein HPY83_07675 [Anaerolineae bacterium]|nr:hypothetical protein [Anaerolineae bacterium]